MATVLKQISPAKTKKPGAGTVHWLNECIERGKTEKFTATTLLTPALAEILLGNMVKNRNIKEVKVAQYRDDLLNGRWRHNLESIKLHKDGRLADGQHRCTVVVATSTPLATEIAFGLDDDDVRTLDIGATRTAGDFAKMDGVSDPMLAAAVARLVIAYEREGGTRLGKQARISTPDVLARIDKDRWIAPAAAFAGHHRSKVPGIPGSVLGLCWYLFASIHRNDAEEYLGQIVSGANLREGDPALTVQRYLIQRAGKPGVGREKRIEAIMRGWNAFRDGRTLQSISTGRSDSRGFPELS